jgi:hypothetical protein
LTSDAGPEKRGRARLRAVRILVGLWGGDQAGIGHAGAMWSGLDGRTVALGVSAVVLAVALGAVAGMSVGAWAGVLAALAGLVPPAVLAVAVERRQRVTARERGAPPAPMGDEGGGP